jgi:hypothetical protein
VVLGEVLEEEAEPTEVVYLDEVRIIDDRGKHLACVVDALGLLDEALLAADVNAVSVDLEGVAEDSQNAVIGVERPVDDRCDESLGVVINERVLDDALAGARIADDDAQAALLAMNTQRVEDLLLVG